MTNDKKTIKKIVLRTGWIKWGGEGVGWCLDEDESTIELPQYDGSDSQSLTFEVISVEESSS